MSNEARFSVGEEVVVAGFIYANDFIGNLNVFEKPLGCVIKTLVIKEHHKVPGSYETDDTLKYDGFIAEDKVNKQVYFNQYPRAYYGQISDIKNRLFISQEKPNERLYTLSELLDNAVTYIKSEVPYENTEDFKTHFEIFLKEFEKTIPGKTIKIVPLSLKGVDEKDILIPDCYTTEIVDK